MMKIKQWFIGLMYSVFGWSALEFGLGIITEFKDMMQLTGGEFVWSFVIFVLDILGFVFLPYFVFVFVKSEVHGKWENNIHNED